MTLETTEITLAQICDAIEAELDDAAGLSDSQSYDQLKEGVADTPLLQVYWQSTDSDPEQLTYRQGVRPTRHVFHADLYARQRSMLDEDMAAVLEMAHAIMVKLKQGEGPLFDLEGLRSLTWRAERVQFEYANAYYAGARFLLTVEVY